MPRKRRSFYRLNRTKNSITGVWINSCDYTSFWDGRDQSQKTKGVNLDGNDDDGIDSLVAGWGSQYKSGYKTVVIKQIKFKIYYYVLCSPPAYRDKLATCRK